VLLLAIVAFLTLLAGCMEQKECPPCVCDNCNVSSTDVGIIYLIPENCQDCNLAMLQDISYELDIEHKLYFTDSVSRQSVLITKDNKATLAAASSRGNVLKALCDFSDYEMACNILNNSNKSSSVTDCLENYNISANSVVFFHADWCSHCKKMMPWVRQLENESYSFLWIEVSDKDKMNIAQKCLSDILDLRGGVPQFACPANGEHHLGEIRTIDDMKNFAARCMSS